MKVIDLLNKIANGEEVPRTIRINNIIYNFTLRSYPIHKLYEDENRQYYWDIQYEYLNDEVEIINNYTNKFLEVWESISKQFGKLFDELIRIKNDLGLNLEDNIIEELQEHKIPKKWEDLAFTTMRKRENSIDDDIEKIKGYIETIMRTQNEILDYLEKIK